MVDIRRLNRRQFVASALAVSLGGLAGCSGQVETAEETTESDTRTSTRTRTPTQTQTSTPEPAAFEVSAEAPNTVDADEEFHVELTVTNTGGERGTFLSPVESQWTSEGSWESTNESAMVAVESGETATEELAITAPVEEGTREYRLSGSGVEATWSVDVTTENATPDIEFVNLVSDWTQFGDAEAKAIDNAPAGEPITLAARYDIFSHSGTVDVAREIRIDETATDRQVASDFRESESLVDYSGYSEWEFYQEFGTDGWDPGEYRAEVTIRDNISNEVSDRYDYTFELE